MAPFLTRFAPSPTGNLHLGHVYSAFQVRRAADAAGGQALLRIEDTDLTRCRPEFETAIHEDLAWLGLDWEGEVRRQSDHLNDYTAVVDALRARGLVYRCFKSRSKIAELMGNAPGDAFVSGPLPDEEEAEKLASGAAFAWRLSLAAARDTLGSSYRDLTYTVEALDGTGRHTVPCEPERFGDIALTRKDAPAAYHLAACHDDALQGITHIIRGEDLIDAPHIHTLLQALMDWPRPIYRHHKLLMGPDGRRLSKSDRSKTVASLRTDGLTPTDVRALADIN